MAVALLLRLPNLNSGLWFDEIWLLVETIRAPFLAFYTTFASDNNHPFYSLLAWLSVHAFGESPWSLRLPALVFGVASVGMLWGVALRVASRKEAAVATGLMAVSYHHVWFSQNARGYTMLLFWTLSATYFLLRVYDGRGRGSWIAYGVCLALATYTHSSAVLVALAHGVVSLCVLARGRGDGWTPAEHPWRPLLGLALAGGLSLLLHASILVAMLDFFLADAGGTSGGGGLEDSEWSSPWWTVRAAAESLGLGLLPGLAALAAALVTMTVGTLELLRRDWRATLLFVLPAIIAIVATFALGRSLRPRFMFNLAGFMLIIAVAGVFRTCRWAAGLVASDDTRRLTRRLQLAATAAMAALSLVILPRAYLLPKQDFEGAMAYVERVRDAGEVVLTTGLTVLPYRDYFRAPYPAVASSEDLDSALRVASAVYVLHTLPIFLESTAPELAARLNRGEEVARFPGSLGGGDVVVVRIEGRRLEGG